MLACWVALAISVVSMSTGGIWFSLLSPTPPILRACWRLTMTSFMQLPPLIYELVRLRSQPEDERRELLRRWLRSSPKLCFCGVLLALHFACWSWSLDHTTLTRALLFISTGPFIIVVRLTLFWFLILALKPVLSSLKLRINGGSTALDDVELQQLADYSQAPGEEEISDEHELNLSDDEAEKEKAEAENEEGEGKPHDDDEEEEEEEDGLSVSGAPSQQSWLAKWMEDHRHPPTLLEFIGTAVGTASAVLLVLAGNHESSETGPTPSFEGDFAAVLGAGLFVWYMEIGADLRQWLPLFMYALPVTASSAVFAGIVSLLVESVSFSDLFVWLTNSHQLLLVTGAALVAGILGHTFLNMSLLHITPLIASVVCLGEPIAGSVIGWAIGVSGAPGYFTIFAGALLLFGAVLTTLGQRSAGYSDRVWRFVFRC